MDSLLFSVSLRASPSVSFAPLSASRGSYISLQYSNHESSKVVRGSRGVALQGCLVNHHIDSKLGKPIFFLSQKKSCISAISKHPLGSEPESYGSKSAWTEIQTSLDVFYRFTRPHTIIGTALSIISVSLLAVESMSDLSPIFFTGLLEALVGALFMNIYIVGLNQLFDIEIDRVNKPNLPLASGEYSVRTGVAIVSTFAVLEFNKMLVSKRQLLGGTIYLTGSYFVFEMMSFIIAWAVHSWPLFWALFVSFVLGTAYSINLPFLRWKRFALVAAMCILAVRAVVVQLAFFLHMQTFVFQRPAIFSKPLIFATAFMSFFSVVIALFKDIPDIDGDRIFGIQSFSVRLGQKRVFWTCIYLLQMAYCVAVMMGLSSSYFWSKVATVSGHIILAVILGMRAQSIDLKSKAAITSFYMFIWKLFYAEYLLIPFVR